LGTQLNETKNTAMGEHDSGAKQDMPRQVVVTGIGVIVPGATGKDQFWGLIQAGKSAVGPLTRLEANSLPCRIAGEIYDFNPGDFVQRNVSRRLDRASLLAVAAARLACTDARLDLSRCDRSRVGVFEGTSLGPLNSTLDHHRKYLSGGCNHASPTALISGMMGAGSGHIAQNLEIHGPSLTISDGSASSAYAIGYGFRSIKAGQLDLAIVGGAEAPLSEEVVAAFCCARLLSTRNDRPHESMRPFDRDRDGFVLAEGAAFLLLEELSQALARNARVYAEITGFGETTDAFHPTSPDPSGTWIARSMELALQEAEIQPDQVQYLNAHGTATRINDTVEATSIKRVFSSHISDLAVSSTKPITGHALGACGAIEAGTTVLSLCHEFIPPTLNLLHKDDECDLDVVPGRGRNHCIEVAMSNNYSFGGRNASLVFKRSPRSLSHY
jgi:3-oxoacyl-[acyl-carrier-protein] synthase II